MSLLQVSNISKAFVGVKAVNGVSFNLPGDQLLALLGPNGAGKSTYFNILNGQYRPDSGSILFDGHEIGGMKPREIWRLGGSRSHLPDFGHLQFEDGGRKRSDGADFARAQAVSTMAFGTLVLS